MVTAIFKSCPCVDFLKSTWLISILVVEHAKQLRHVWGTAWQLHRYHKKAKLHISRLVDKSGEKGEKKVQKYIFFGKIGAPSWKIQKVAA